MTCDGKVTGVLVKSNVIGVASPLKQVLPDFHFPASPPVQLGEADGRYGTLKVWVLLTSNEPGAGVGALDTN
jgi:hypothetical protein